MARLGIKLLLCRYLTRTPRTKLGSTYSYKLVTCRFNHFEVITDTTPYKHPTIEYKIRSDVFMHYRMCVRPCDDFGFYYVSDKESVMVLKHKHDSTMFVDKHKALVYDLANDRQMYKLFQTMDFRDMVVFAFSKLA